MSDPAPPTPTKFNPRELFAQLDRAVRAAEPALINAFAAASPWAAPVFPAALTCWNLLAHILTGWEPWAAWPVAAVTAFAVEALGISSTNQTIKLWAKNKATEQGLLRLSLFTGGHYLLTVIAANVVLETALAAEALATGKATPWQSLVTAAVIFAKALLCTLSVTGAVNIAVRARSGESELQAEEKRAEKKSAKLSAANSQINSQPMPANAAPDRKKWVRDYMASNKVSQATAYREYKKKYS